MNSLNPSADYVNQENAAALELKRLVDEAFARTARKPKEQKRRTRSAPAPAPLKPSPFAVAALQLRDYGLAVLPVSREKKPCVSGFNAWRHRPWSKQIEQWIKKFPAAQIGILCGLSKLTVVDLDNVDLLQYALKRWGHTPLIVRTNRGFHLYYRSNRWDKSCNLRFSEGLDIDVKAGVAFVMVPPSLNSAGNELVFHTGSWADLAQLPCYKDTLAVRAKVREKPKDGDLSARASPPIASVPVGQRNSALMAYLHTNRWRSLEEASAAALEWNEAACIVPEEAKRVLASVRSFWLSRSKHGPEGVGQRGFILRTSLGEKDAEKRIKDVAKSKAALQNALILYDALVYYHWSRGEEFAIDRIAMAKAGSVKGLTEKTIHTARETLLKAGLIIQIRPFQPKPRRCALYKFARKTEGTENAPIP